jgi:hypothetical protein
VRPWLGRLQCIINMWKYISPSFQICLFSLVDDVTRTTTAMDAHYDLIAASLARFRSTKNPSDQLLACKGYLYLFMIPNIKIWAPVIPSWTTYRSVGSYDNFDLK